MHEFEKYHPAVSFTYFICVIVFSMVFMHPAMLAISFFGGLLYAIITANKKMLLYLLPLMLVTAVINPAFSHEGVTILCYLPSNNPLTAESVYFGFACAFMIGSVMCHFASFNKVMTSDKLLYLFCKITPSLSLILSMVLRFVPRFKAQLEIVRNAQKCVGRDLSQGSILQRTKKSIKILSIMITWSLENAIDTSDSMKSRGYGLPKRTAFVNYRFDKRDLAAFVVILALGIYVVAGGINGVLVYKYFPALKGAEITCYSISVFICYGMLVLSPVIIEAKEAVKWNTLKSKI